MNNTSKILSIIAFYLSEYDMEAVSSLGYNSRTEAFKNISLIFNRDNNYLKLRRDEFDVITSSHRNGWRNRKPANDVLLLAEYLKTFSFDQMTSMVISLIENKKGVQQLDVSSSELISGREIELRCSDEELERIINYEDPTADLVIHTGITTRRIYRQKIIEELKQLYKFQCQICGYSFFDNYGVKLAEAHHIEHFCKTHNNNANNIIILCPNHHRIVHRLNPLFDQSSLVWIYPNGIKEPLLMNYHL